VSDETATPEPADAGASGGSADAGASDGPVDAGTAGAPVAPDPWKGFRGVTSAVLIFEAVTVLLGLLVVTKFSDSGGTAAVVVVLLLAVGMIIVPRYLSRPWGYKLVVALQVGLILAGVLSPVLGAMGMIFGLVWVAIWYMHRDVAAKMARGELPSQRTDRLPDRE
jgi:hypothetical protein